MRRLFRSLNLVATLALLFFLFIMVNYLSSRHYARWDLTRTQITALSPTTLQMLQTLKEPVSVIVFYQPQQRLYDLVKDLLSEYERRSPKIEAEFVDPEQDVARARQLVQEFQIDASDPNALNLVIFKRGNRHKYISDTELAEYDYSEMSFATTPRVRAFKGEEAFTSAILNVTQEYSPLVWIVAGHGEKSVENAEELSDLRRFLEQQNLTVETVKLLTQEQIPPAVKLLMIPGPNRRFTEQEIVLIQDYLQRGGRLLALIDPLVDSGLDGLLERWGLRLGMDVVVDPTQQIPFVSPANVLITTYTQHPVVEKMKTLITLFPLARSVNPVEPAPAGISVSALALTTEGGWGEVEVSVKNFEFNADKDLPGPVSVAAVSESHPSAPIDETLTQPPAQARIVAIGDSDFILNGQLGNVGNRDFLLAAVLWLIEQQERIGIGPKTLESLKLSLTQRELMNTLWFSFLAMPAIVGMLGIGMWWLRRK
ncbi:MAG: Gldg family protein [Candidatus Omnitrophica bacterium]|nr:Gldg family protein [Candidatus Omnitrophota bacterium]